jgi:hypothetical protein
MLKGGMSKAAVSDGVMSGFLAPALSETHRKRESLPRQTAEICHAARQFSDYSSNLCPIFTPRGLVMIRPVAPKDYLRDKTPGPP